MERFVIRVYYRGKMLGEKVEDCNTVPRKGDGIEVANASWTVDHVLWRWFGTYPRRTAVCFIHFGRESEGAYWVKEDFWREHGFFEHAEVTADA